MGIDIKNISTDGSTIKNYQKEWRGQIHTSLKSDAAKREIDVHSTVAAMLKKFIGERKQGLLFCSRKQLWQANIFQLRPHGRGCDIVPGNLCDRSVSLCIQAS